MILAILDPLTFSKTPPRVEPDRMQVGVFFKRSERKEWQGSCRTGPSWSFWQEWCEYHMIENQTPIDAWTLLKIWVAAFSANPPPWVHCLAIFTHVRALSLCLTILPGILRGKIYRLLSHVACTWAGLRGVSHPSSAAFPRLLTQCSAFKWPLIGCDCSASHPSEYFCN